MSKQQRKRIFTGVKFSVDVVQRPKRGGGTTQREIVVHPGAVVILGLLKGDQVVLIRNKRFAVGKTLWELPAGTLEPPEPPKTCAGRELIEETGYKARKLTKLTAFYTTPGMCTELMHAYLATDLTHVGQALEETEEIEVRPTPLKKVLEMIRRGQIVDGKSIATVLFYTSFASAKHK
jgi:ADP-ribose pyrophosphatase